jgi:hypothetical protein
LAKTSTDTSATSNGATRRIQGGASVGPVGRGAAWIRDCIGARDTTGGVPCTLLDRRVTARPRSAAPPLSEVSSQDALPASAGGTRPPWLGRKTRWSHGLRRRTRTRAGTTNRHGFAPGTRPSKAGNKPISRIFTCQRSTHSMPRSDHRTPAGHKTLVSPALCQNLYRPCSGCGC